jgi:site-specific DNA-methyltransferase (cytosine-N4-specific)
MNKHYSVLLEDSGLDLVREQLLLFEVAKKKESRKGEQLEVVNWDFAKADTKTETHCFHAYPAMMIPQIARSLIELYGRRGGTLLDPFCGSGTALVEAKLAGMNSYGIDINPLALLLARAKTRILDIGEIKRESIRLLDRYGQARAKFRGTPDAELVPDFFNLEYWFSAAVRRELAILRSQIFQIKSLPVREFFLVAFSETARDTSYTRNGEFKLFRMPDELLSRYKPDVPDVFFGKVYRNLKGLSEFVRRAYRRAWVKVLDEDTRKQTSIPSASVDLVVTSPPYGDSRTTVAYGQFSRLSLQWLKLPWERVREIDTHSLGGRRIAQLDGVDRIRRLKSLLREVELLDKKRAVDVGSFFHDLHLCVLEISRTCRIGATACFVVGNRTVKGVTIPTDEILAQIAKRAGFGLLETIKRNIPNKRMPLRNSPSNVEGELGETISKEHIVVLEKTEDVAHH